MKEITRSEAIANLRKLLFTVIDSETSLCKAACELGIFCGGFSQWDSDELRARFAQLAGGLPDLERHELEHIANLKQLSRQSVANDRLPCDVPLEERHEYPCAGWNEFYEAELARFLSDLCGEEIRVVPDQLRSSD